MPSQSSNLMDSVIRISLVALLALWCFQIARPFINPIAWAGIIAIGVFPIFVFIKNKTGLSNALSSTILTLFLLAILIVPSLMLADIMIENTQSLSELLENDELKIPPPNESISKLPVIGEKLHAFWQKASEDHQAAFGKYEPQLKNILSWAFSTVAITGLNIIVFIFSIIIAGVFMASANGVKESMELIFTRLAGERGLELTKLSRDTVQSVVRGILGIAVLQAVLAALGFIAMDIPAAGLLAIICLVLAIVQIDVLIILIPLSILAFSNPDISTGAAITFLVWNIAVGLLNNILKPVLLAKGVEAPMAVIFVGAIGG